MNKQSLFISNFKKNILFMTKLIVVCITVGAFCYFINAQFDDGYCASLSDKIDRLKNLDGPKLVLIGDSNLAFGMDSKLLEESMQMPVVNMGLHGGIGNAFHENMAKINVVPGDVYVYCPDIFGGFDGIEDGVLVWTALRNDVRLYRLIPRQEVWGVVKCYPTFLKRGILQLWEERGNKSDEIYSRSNFNEYGDIVYKNPEYRYNFAETIEPSQISDSTVRRMNDLAKWLSERGATLVVAAYPIGDGELTVDAKEFVKFQEKLEEKLVCEIISDYTDYMFDYEYFYDTSLHLTVEGTELRTKQLIEDLKNSNICKK